MAAASAPDRARQGATGEAEARAQRLGGARLRDGLSHPHQQSLIGGFHGTFHPFGPFYVGHVGGRVKRP